jgi:hypothetical protein
MYLAVWRHFDLAGHSAVSLAQVSSEFDHGMQGVLRVWRCTNDVQRRI